MRKVLVSLAMVASAPWTMASAQVAAPVSRPMGDMAMPKCDVIATPPAELAGWTIRSVMAAAVDAGGLGKAVLTPGAGVDATLSQTSAVRYTVRPEKPGGSVSYGGMFAFTVKQAGTYRIALGSAAWVDVVKEGTSSISTAHGHGPDCTGIRKMVDFVLQPGRYTLQLAANGAPTLPLLITRLP